MCERIRGGDTKPLAHWPLNVLQGVLGSMAFLMHLIIPLHGNHKKETLEWCSNLHTLEEQCRKIFYYTVFVRNMRSGSCSLSESEILICAWSKKSCLAKLGAHLEGTPAYALYSVLTSDAALLIHKSPSCAASQALCQLKECSCHIERF